MTVTSDGTLTFRESGPDQVTASWQAGDGSLIEWPLSLREAADLQAGKAVSRYGGVRRFTLRERIAALRARNDQIAAQMNELRRQRPDIDQDGSIS